MVGVLVAPGSGIPPHHGLMSVPQDISRSLTRRVLDGDLPGPVFAVVGLVDEMAQQTRGALAGAARAPSSLVASVADQYDAFVARGQDRAVEIATERAVRARVSRLEDRVAPSAARATVRLNERRKRWNQSPTASRATVAKERARAAATRFNELNTPVLEDQG